MSQESAQWLVLVHACVKACSWLLLDAAPWPLCLAAWWTSCLRPALQQVYVRLSVAVLEQKTPCCHALPVQLPCPSCAAVLPALVQCPPAALAPGVASLPEHCSKVMNSSLVNLSKCLALAIGLVLFALIMWVFACLQLGGGFIALPGWLLWHCVLFCRWIGFIVRVLP